MKEKRISRDGFQLWYSTYGDAFRPAVVFLHPAFADHTCFDQQIGAFEREFHVLCVDMPGHGNSSLSGGKATVDETADFLAEILPLEGHSSAHVIGVSLGSLVAQYFAYRHPSLTNTLTLTGGYSLFHDTRRIVKAQRRKMIQWIALALFSMERFRTHISRQVAIEPTAQEKFYQASQRFPFRSFQALSGMRALFNLPPPPVYPPTLILVGERDLPLLVQHGQEWNERQPATRFRVIPDAGHCAHMDNPRVFNAEVTAFLHAYPPKGSS